ncbi:MAG: ATP-binding cassette domain-containing protein, partial [Caulobacteraceae bacterium]
MASNTNTTTNTPLHKALRLATAPLVTAGVFSFASNIMYLALPIFMTQVYSRVLSSESQETLWVLTIGAIAAFMVSAVLEYLRARVLINFGVVFDERISGAVFVTLFDAIVRGDPSARAQGLRDVDTVRQTVTGSGATILFDLPFMPIYLGLLFVIDPFVGGLTLVGGLILLSLALLQDRFTRRRLKESNDAALQSYTFTDASLRNGEVVRALGMLPSLGRLWKRFRRITIEDSAAASQAAGLCAAATKAVRMSIQILIIALGAYLVLQHKIGPAVLYANMILASRALAPIERAVGSWNSMIGGYQAYERLSKLLQSYEPSQPKTQLPRPLGALTVEGMSYAVPRPNQPLLLNGVSFAVLPGETVGVVGPSGAGKSTLARLLVGVWKPVIGHIRLDGADVFTWDRAAFGRFVGYLPQDVELFSGTVRDNIARFRFDAEDAAVIDAAMMAGAHELILTLPKGYDTDLGRAGSCCRPASASASAWRAPCSAVPPSSSSTSPTPVSIRKARPL